MLIADGQIDQIAVSKTYCSEEGFLFVLFESMDLLDEENHVRPSFIVDLHDLRSMLCIVSDGNLLLKSGFVGTVTV